MFFLKKEDLFALNFKRNSLIVQKHSLIHCSEYNVNNIFSVSHILSTYFTSLEASEMETNRRSKEIIGNIVQGFLQIICFLFINNLSKETKNTQEHVSRFN